MKPRIIHLFILLATLSVSCDTLYKDEKIPAYIQVDSLNYQGISPNGFSCFYLYVNYKLVGVFESPKTIPILEAGDSRVTIRPGIDLNGYTYERNIYHISSLFETRMTLIPGKIHNIKPTFADLPTVRTAWSENFESSAITLLSADSLTPQIKIRRDNRVGHKGYIGEIKIVPSDTLTSKFDYTCNDSIPIYFKSVPGYFEFSYQSNEPIEVRLKAYSPGSGQQHDKTVLFAYKSEDSWRRIFIDFSLVVSEMGSLYYYKPYFRIRRLINTQSSDTVNVKIDDIRIVYIKS